MFTFLLQSLPFLSPLVGETAGPEYQAEWWFIGFLCGISISVCGAIVRAIRMSGGNNSEL